MPLKSIGPMGSQRSDPAFEEIDACHVSGLRLDEKDNAKIYGATAGRLVGLKATGEPLVDFPGNISGSVLTARSIVTMGAKQVGREVLLTFEEGDPDKPVVVGVLEKFGEKTKDLIELRVDEDRLVLSAEREIVLRCGQASVTLTREGKVLIRGTYVLSRSAGVNRIKGGSVQIN